MAFSVIKSIVSRYQHFNTQIFNAPTTVWKYLDFIVTSSIWNNMQWLFNTILLPPYWMFPIYSLRGPREGHIFHMTDHPANNIWSVLPILENKTQYKIFQLKSNNGRFKWQWLFKYNKVLHATIQSPRPLPYWIIVNTLKSLHVICNRRSIRSDQGKDMSAKTIRQEMKKTETMKKVQMPSLIDIHHSLTFNLYI